MFNKLRLKFMWSKNTCVIVRINIIYIYIYNDWKNKNQKYLPPAHALYKALR